MPLSNAQYDEIMHEYDERQLHNRHILETCLLYTSDAADEL